MAKKDVTPKQAEQAARALEALFASEYVDRKKLYFANFMRGIWFSIGSVIGAAIILTLLLWILSAFERVPLIGPVTENVKQSIEQK